jgi:hypothetical protein
MDINDNITRTKKKEEKHNVVFELDCKVVQVTNEDYKFTGSVKANMVDTELMSSILTNIIKKSMPEDAIEDVIELTLDKLGLIEDDDHKCDCDCNRKITKENIIDFLNTLFGE